MHERGRCRALKAVPRRVDAAPQRPPARQRLQQLARRVVDVLVVGLRGTHRVEGLHEHDDQHVEHDEQQQRDAHVLEDVAGERRTLLDLLGELEEPIEDDREGDVRRAWQRGEARRDGTEAHLQLRRRLREGRGREARPGEVGPRRTWPARARRPTAVPAQMARLTSCPKAAWSVARKRRYGARHEAERKKRT